jgi:hypothetical protein
MTSIVTRFVATTRQPNLLDEAGMAEQARAGHLDRGLEEEPDQEPREQEERIVLDRDRAHDHREDEPVREHEHDRVDQRPRDPKRRAAVLHAQLAPEEVQEEIAVAEEIDVDTQGQASVLARFRLP